MASEMTDANWIRSLSNRRRQYIGYSQCLSTGEWDYLIEIAARIESQAARIAELEIICQENADECRRLQRLAELESEGLIPESDWEMGRLYLANLCDSALSVVVFNGQCFTIAPRPFQHEPAIHYAPRNVKVIRKLTLPTWAKEQQLADAKRTRVAES